MAHTEHMSGPTTPTLVGPKPVVAGRITWVPLACVLAVAAGYAVFFVLPYFVNGLYRYPIEDVAVGYHDPKELWPFDTAWGFVAGLGGLVTLGLGPLVTLGAASGAVILLWRDRAVLDGRGRDASRCRPRGRSGRRRLPGLALRRRPHVLVPRLRLLAQSRADAQSMHSRAVGRASRRASPIGRPHRSQVP